MKEIKAYSIQEDVWFTSIYDSLKCPPRFKTRESYILTNKEPVSGGKIMVFYDMVITPYENRNMRSNVHVKIPEKAFIKEIDFEEFEKIFKRLGGTIEESSS